MPSIEQTLRSDYRACNARDIDAVLELMDPNGVRSRPSVARSPVESPA
jgi:hypothetical protein